MKVLLISENRTTTLVAPFPIGLAFVAGGLRRAGHEVAVLDLMFLQHWQESLRDAVAQFEPDVIGLSVRNIDNQDSRSPIFFLSDHLDIVALCRTYSSALLVVGGSGFNIHPAGCIRYLGVDLGVYGEGEESFPLLLESLETAEFGEAAGAVWKRDGHVVVNPPRYTFDPDTWPRPSFDDFDVKAYHDDNRSQLPGCITVQTKRGCHMKCVYCSTPLLEGRKSRSRNLRECVAEMAGLYRAHNIRRFYVADNVFNFPLLKAKEFCGEIISQGLNISWQAIINPAFGDDGLFELMGKAGCTFVSLGNESGHELILRNLRKGFTLDNVRHAARRARENGIRYGCFLLLGGPGETRDTVEESVAFVDELSPDMVSVKAGIRIYPGTPLEAIARREGMIEKNQDLLYPAFYLSPGIREWVWAYLEKVAGDRNNWRV